jgi:hypothetical protein
VQLRNIDRLIFVWMYRLFPSILNAITVVTEHSQAVLDGLVILAHATRDSKHAMLMCRAKRFSGQ